MARQNSRDNSMYSQRKVSGRSKNKTFLIVCEGTETEPNYFASFQKIAHAKKIAKINIEPAGCVGKTLVEKAKNLKKLGNYADDEVWCVFDRDLKKENNNQQNFNAAIKTAIESKLNLAVSNDAFELWFLLHYEYYVSQTHRSDYEKLLSAKTRLNEKYEKNSKDMYDKLKDKQLDAIKFAKRLWSSYGDENEVDDPDQLTIQERIKRHNMNPSTTVYQLVEKLNQVIFPEEKFNQSNTSEEEGIIAILIILIIASGNFLLLYKYFQCKSQLSNSYIL
ncbi:MAG TPA: RloB family protein [Nostocaceae cyanobacterium]|nr:RloB family protein [Nostocaceae cyanobacterium]